jgi:hypothetical protein
MTNKLKEIVISSDDAVFWMDKNGRWHNKNGKFEHKKIIDYFHSCIRKDRDGFYLDQINGDFREKVYFRYEETAFFVFDVIESEDIILVLNTKKQIKLDPTKLSVEDDNLYMQWGDERIKFAERALLKISDRIEIEDNRYFFRLKNKRYRISDRSKSNRKF